MSAYSGFFRGGAILLVLLLAVGGAASASLPRADTSSIDHHLTTQLAPGPAPRNNTPPVANFSITPEEGWAGTVFALNASLSSDAEDSLGQLEFRWDFGDDGTWEVGWSIEPVTSFASQVPGPVPVRLVVRDSGGLTDTTVREVSVVGTSTWRMAGIAPYVFVVQALVLILVVALLSKAGGEPRRRVMEDDPEEPPIRE